LVLCDCGGLVSVNAFVRSFCGFFAWFFNAGARGARWFMPMFRAYYRFMALPQAAAAEQREKIIRSGYEIAPLLRDAWRGFGQADADLRETAQALSVPVWFAWAKQDRVIPLGMCMPCIRKMKQATLTKFDGGHTAFLEQPAAFVAGFKTFASTLKSA
jgi:pimeloyl-ACP methyl ester carboxylesterase